MTSPCNPCGVNRSIYSSVSRPFVFRTHIHPHTRIHGETDLIIRSVVNAPLLCSWMSAHYILLLLLFLSVSNTRQHDQCRSLALNEVLAQHCKHFVFRPMWNKTPYKTGRFYERWFGKQEHREELAAICFSDAKIWRHKSLTWRTFHYTRSWAFSTDGQHINVCLISQYLFEMLLIYLTMTIISKSNSSRQVLLKLIFWTNIKTTLIQNII